MKPIRLSRLSTNRASIRITQEGGAAGPEPGERRPHLPDPLPDVRPDGSPQSAHAVQPFGRSVENDPGALPGDLGQFFQDRLAFGHGGNENALSVDGGILDRKSVV